MAFVIIVMAVAFSAVCAFQYQHDVTEVQSALATVVEKQPPFNNQEPLPVEDVKDSNFTATPYQRDKDTSESNDKGPNPFKLGRAQNGEHQNGFELIPIAVYEIDSDNNIALVSDNATAYIAEDVLDEAIQNISQRSDGYGELSNVELLYYKVQNTDTNTIRIAFANASLIKGWENLAIILLFVGLGTIAIFFIAALFLSKRALKPVRDAWDSQRQFVADASHDLKTPLTVILANMSILSQHPQHTISQESQWIENTQHEANNMQELISEMLELAQVESHTPDNIIQEEVDFSDLVEEQVLLLDAMAIEKGCVLDCEADENVCVLGDAPQLSKMVKTLLENALKYVNADGTVLVRLIQNINRVQLSISNTGTPIPEEDIEHIFDRFYRSDKARTSGEGGFGLGLAIAMGIAQSHGGNITCSSDEKETVFTVILPVSKK